MYILGCHLRIKIASKNSVYQAQGSQYTEQIVADILGHLSAGCIVFDHLMLP